MSLLRLFSARNSKKFLRRYSSQETIFSHSSGYGKCGVSIIRVSGSKALNAVKSLISSEFLPKPRYAVLKYLRHPQTKDVLDKGLVLWFPGPKSFTGEDCCEFQVHGSVAVVAAMLDALASVPGLRMAKPGEFTRRAFFNGKLDLTEVDGLADLIHAETDAQRKQALLQTDGALSKLYKTWRTKIIRCVAHMEAYIDFAEDENIEDNILENLQSELTEIINEIKIHLNDKRQGEMLRHGVRSVIVGAPNVGKSSFLNLICQRPISIVTSIAGTTRDVIESPFNIAGYPVLFADTAGLRRNTEDLVESEGISRAINYIQQSDLVILMIDAVDFFKSNKSLENYKNDYLESLNIKLEYLEGKQILVVINKTDLIDTNQLNHLVFNLKDVCLISCKENVNIQNVLELLTKCLKKICGQPSAENPRLTQSRYRHLLTDCLQHLESFLKTYTIDSNPDLAIATQKLRSAVRCIERITGDVTTEEILDVIFRDFCIGK